MQACIRGRGAVPVSCPARAAQTLSHTSAAMLPGIVPRLSHDAVTCTRLAHRSHAAARAQSGPRYVDARLHIRRAVLLKAADPRGCCLWEPYGVAHRPHRTLLSRAARIAVACRRYGGGLRTGVLRPDVDACRRGLDHLDECAGWRGADTHCARQTASVAVIGAHAGRASAASRGVVVAVAASAS